MRRFRVRPSNPDLFYIEEWDENKQRWMYVREWEYSNDFNHGGRESIVRKSNASEAEQWIFDKLEAIRKEELHNLWLQANPPYEYP